MFSLSQRNESWLRGRLQCAQLRLYQVLGVFCSGPAYRDRTVTSHRVANPGFGDAPKAKEQTNTDVVVHNAVNVKFRRS